MTRLNPGLGLDFSALLDAGTKITTSIAEAEAAKKNAQAAASNAAAANSRNLTTGRKVPPIAYAAAAVAIGGLVWMFIRGRRGRGRGRR